MNKDKNSYKTIGEVARIVGLVDKKKGRIYQFTCKIWGKASEQKIHYSSR